ncbi:hypothetical protein Q3G72_025484 [Acer saccharum]|nr:hypothetical protein Q3G72_025484 [Acer saccharum]
MHTKLAFLDRSIGTGAQPTSEEVRSSSGITQLLQEQISSQKLSSPVNTWADKEAYKDTLLKLGDLYKEGWLAYDDDDHLCGSIVM